jgi:hypothetical protein
MGQQKELLRHGVVLLKGVHRVEGYHYSSDKGMCFMLAALHA